jgi:preprotein translocase subunit SecD
MYYFFSKILYFLLYSIICFPQLFPLFQVSQSKVKIEFRLAEISPGPGLTEAKVDGPLQTVYLHKGAVITNEDIIEARAPEEPNRLGGYDVIVVFTKKAGERMATITKQKRGLLAILINGKVVAAMGILTQIHDRTIISGPRTKDETKDLAAMLNKGAGAGR